MLALIGALLTAVALIGLKTPSAARVLGWSTEAGLGLDGTPGGDGTDPGTDTGAGPVGPTGAAPDGTPPVNSEPPASRFYVGFGSPGLPNPT